MSNPNEPALPDEPAHRLPSGVTPSHYRLRLEPDLDSATFTGSVTISVVVDRPCDRITMNAATLTIRSARHSADGVDWVAAAHTIDHAAERLTIDGPFPAGTHLITIDYDGILNDRLVGFYLSRFDDVDGSEQRLATTQFESTHARMAFPCWDEPGLKATFELEIVADPHHQAIANTAEIGTDTLPDGRVLHRFAPTIVMSTYLVGFIVGPLEFSETVDVDGIPLRIVHVPGKGHLTDFALESGAFALRYFAEYFGTPCPGDKCDLVAIPDFASGAMENLGIITFRERLLLIDPAAATQPELQRAADVIHHELAHMWFGDLVTMKWWNGLWLKEAFATFMEMRCTDAFRPAWDRWTEFGISRSAAFDTDSLASTRPIEFEVRSPADAEGMFDVLTYEKGAAVVRMLEQFLGEDRFRAGIRRYIATHQYANADTGDLWDAIEAETGEPVRQLMDSWIYQGGFPLVTVRIGADRRRVTFDQERFGYVGGDPIEPQQRMVPLRVRWKPVGGEPVVQTLLLEQESTVIELDGEVEWLVANADSTGFLRVAYPPEVVEDLAISAQEILRPVERYALVDDAWAMVMADRLSASQFLSVLELMTAESDRSVWQRMVAGFSAIDRLIDGDAAEPFSANVHDALAPALAGLGLTPLPADTDRERQLRGDLIRAMGIVARDHEIQEEAKRTMSVVMRDPQLVDAAITAAAVDIVATIGDEADFDDFRSAAASASTPQEETRYLFALADFPDHDLLARVESDLLTGAVRSQNVALWIRRAMTNRLCGREVWQFVMANWEQLVELIPSGSVFRLAEGVTSLTDPEDVTMAADFFAAHPIPQADKTLRQILERQRVGAALRNREHARLQALLAP
jgi:puromycin-sensitive aminopeptidase